MQRIVRDARRARHGLSGGNRDAGGQGDAYLGAMRAFRPAPPSNTKARECRPFSMPPPGIEPGTFGLRALSGGARRCALLQRPCLYSAASELILCAAGVAEFVLYPWLP